MPINNDILGIYKSVFITVAGGTARSYIVESASRSVTIDASPKVLMQGSPKTRIMDIGGVTETKAPGSLVGPTFTYIIAKQFENLRQSDRFFYTDVTQSVSFTASKNKTNFGNL